MSRVRPSTAEGRRRRSGIRRVACVAVTGIGVGIVISTSWAAVAAGASDTLAFDARLGRQPLDLSSSSDPVVLAPDRSSTLFLNLRNPGPEPVIVRHVQIRGTAFGITLLSYDVTINALVRPGQSERVDVPVEFVDLGEQADGLLPATMRLTGPRGTELASQEFTVDVQGSPGSLMGVFTTVVAIATGLSIAAIWISIVRRRLPASPLRRGVRLGITGAGVGVTLTLLLSLLLFMPPKGSVWIPLLLVPALGAFALGVVSPGPAVEPDQDQEVEEWMRATVPDAPAH